MIKKIIDYFQDKSSNRQSKTPPKKSSYIIIIGLVGLLLLLIGNIFTSSSKEDTPKNKIDLPSEQLTKHAQPENSTSTSDVKELEASYKKDLEEMLEKINGISEVEVMVNLDSTNIQVFEKNLISGQQATDENDKNGGTRQIEDHTRETQVVLVRQGDKETPLLIQIKKPEVRGVMVVAKGVDHATMKQYVVEAVTRVLDVPSHRVSVMSKN